jgi:hypothetical protein
MLQMICSTNRNDDCRTIEIRHWKYTLRFSLGYFTTESTVHPEVHINLFLVNFLKNGLGIHIDGGISFYLVGGLQNTTACSKITVSVNLVSDDVMNFTMFERRKLFLNQITQVNFTSVSSHSHRFIVNNHRCNQTWNLMKPVKIKRFRAYPVDKMLFEISKYDVDSLSDNRTFCSNLKVSYEESAVPNQYSKIKITDWSCASKLSSIPLENTDGHEQGNKMIVAIVSAFGLALVVFLVLGCRFFLRNRGVHD